MTAPLNFCDAEYSYSKSASDLTSRCERIEGHPPPHAVGEHAAMLDYEHEMRMRLVLATELQAKAMVTLVSTLQDMGRVLDQLAEDVNLIANTREAIDDEN